MRHRLSDFAFVLASAGVRTWAAVTNAWRLLALDQADNYHPEAYYMRGPGPKWRQKNAQHPPEGRLPFREPEGI
jgi:hypothetical protein